MQAKLFAEYQATDEKLTREYFPLKQRVLMLVLNFIPLLHLISCGVLALCVPLTWKWIVFLIIVNLYITPIILARIVLLCIPIQEGRIIFGSLAFFAWWILLQLQIIFCRIPFFEEVLRLFPGLYSLWLRLWGARIGKFTYWSAGLRILDRPFLHIGDRVVFGAGVRLIPHVIDKNREGKMELLLATLKIGDDSIIGGYSLLTAGTEVASGEILRACLLSPPFSSWKKGKRIKRGIEND